MERIKQRHEAVHKALSESWADGKEGLPADEVDDLAETLLVLSSAFGSELPRRLNLLCGAIPNFKDGALIDIATAARLLPGKEDAGIPGKVHEESCGVQQVRQVAFTQQDTPSHVPSASDQADSQSKADAHDQLHSDPEESGDEHSLQPWLKQLRAADAANALAVSESGLESEEPELVEREHEEAHSVCSEQDSVQTALELQSCPSSKAICIADLLEGLCLDEDEVAENDHFEEESVKSAIMLQSRATSKAVSVSALFRCPELLEEHPAVVEAQLANEEEDRKTEVQHSGLPQEIELTQDEAEEEFFPRFLTKDGCSKTAVFDMTVDDSIERSPSKGIELQEQFSTFEASPLTPKVFDMSLGDDNEDEACSAGSPKVFEILLADDNDDEEEEAGTEACSADSPKIFDMSAEDDVEEVAEAGRLEEVSDLLNMLTEGCRLPLGEAKETEPAQAVVIDEEARSAAPDTTQQAAAVEREAEGSTAAVSEKATAGDVLPTSFAEEAEAKAAVAEMEAEGANQKAIAAEDTTAAATEEVEAAVDEREAEGSAVDTAQKAAAGEDMTAAATEEVEAAVVEREAEGSTAAVSEKATAGDVLPASLAEEAEAKAAVAEREAEGAPDTTQKAIAGEDTTAAATEDVEAAVVEREAEGSAPDTTQKTTAGEDTTAAATEEVEAAAGDILPALAAEEAEAKAEPFAATPVKEAVAEELEAPEVISCEVSPEKVPERVQRALEQKAELEVKDWNQEQSPVSPRQRVDEMAKELHDLLKADSEMMQRSSPGKGAHNLQDDVINRSLVLGNSDSELKSKLPQSDQKQAAFARELPLVAARPVGQSQLKAGTDALGRCLPCGASGKATVF
eukprot:TRINITY_DN876_c0_g1_i2.p1 TRINITY_DN876_c0_g1~~TRINITY_DN876_c0_g1_i2.p1  ORF type:complete len:855 (+),score=277.86 TRINITY_DN876_c0_g1_i2:58-2622(+)